MNNNGNIISTKVITNHGTYIVPNCKIFAHAFSMLENELNTFGTIIYSICNIDSNGVESNVTQLSDCKEIRN